MTPGLWSSSSRPCWCGKPSSCFSHLLVPDPRRNCAQQKAISETWSALSRVFQPKPSATLPREITRHSVVRVAFGQRRVHPASAHRKASPFRLILSQVQVWYDVHRCFLSFCLRQCDRGSFHSMTLCTLTDPFGMCGRLTGGHVLLGPLFLVLPHARGGSQSWPPSVQPPSHPQGFCTCILWLEAPGFPPEHAAI